MLVYFVDPIKPHRAVNLANVKSLKRKNNLIMIDDYTWTFNTVKEASKVYESMIKLAQEFLTRKVNI